jgi:predicted metal-dependent hydrolase
MSELFRYSSRAFPPYTYVPGSGTPHPVSDPRGHMHGHSEPKVTPLDPKNWRDNETYLYAVDLFNHGYYWEAHEAWESLWHAAGHHGKMADFLKGLIKLAAAGVKELEHNQAGVNRHLTRALELLSGVDESVFCGVDLASLIADASQHQLPQLILLAPPLS